MKCHEAATLQLFHDDELDPSKRADFLKHRDQCALCARETTALTELRARLRTEVPYYQMPARLEHALDAAVAQHGRDREAQDRDSRGPRAGRGRVSGAPWIWAGSGALAGSALTIAAIFLIAMTHAWWSNRDLVADVVSAHGRSSITGHVVDVASSDHHTVKPWLSQRLDYSPPVVDLGGRGFALLGGRLDRVEGSSIATLVYRSGQHRIDVFVRPAPSDGHVLEPTMVRGYNVVDARGLGMEWIGVSDVSPVQLKRLVELLAHPPSSADSAEPSTTP